MSVKRNSANCLSQVIFFKGLFMCSYLFLESKPLSHFSNIHVLIIPKKLIINAIANITSNPYPLFNSTGVSVLIIIKKRIKKMLNWNRDANKSRIRILTFLCNKDKYGSIWTKINSATIFSFIILLNYLVFVVQKIRLFFAQV